MKALAICGLLLTLTVGAQAASPEQLWQDYQQRPGYATTAPVKPAPREAAHITVETNDGAAAEPTTPEQAKEKAEVHTEEFKQLQPGPAAETAATKPAEDEAEAQEQVSEPVNPEAELSTIPVETKAAAPAPQPQAATAPVKVKPKISLLKKPPQTKFYMRIPQPADFVSTTSQAGGYTLDLPLAFGSNPLAALPQAEGSMLVRTASNVLMCAAAVLDANDTTSFNGTQPLPAYAGKKVYALWQQGTELVWSCTLSSHDDFYGRKILVEASAQLQGKTYQLLYVMPKDKLGTYLPQALASLNSFKLLTP